RLRHAPTETASVTELAVLSSSGLLTGRCAKLRPRPLGRLTPQQLQHVFELEADLPNDLLALREIRPRFVARQALSRAADREPFLVQEAANLTDDQHVLTLVVPAIAASLYRL